MSRRPRSCRGCEITLAAPEMFDRRGLDRPGFLNASRVPCRRRTQRPQRRADLLARVGRRAVRHVARRSDVASRPATSREYTVLLDPPVLLPGPAAHARRAARGDAPVGAATRPAARSTARRRQHRLAAGARAGARRPRAAHRTSRASSAARPRRAPRLPPRAGLTVPCNEPRRFGRSRIDCRPDGVSINQMMIAIYQANPAGVRRQHQRAARRRDAALARIRGLRHAGHDRRECRGSTADRRVAESRAAKRPAAAVAAGRDRGRARAGSGTRGRRAPRPRRRRASRGRAVPRIAAAAAGRRGKPAAARASATPSCKTCSRPPRPPRQPEAAPPGEPESAAPGVELESEQLFADETEPAAPPAEEAAAALRRRRPLLRRRARDRAVARIAGDRLAASRRCCGSVSASPPCC